MKIGEQVREHRDKAMLTQDELGKKAGLSGYTISRIESDQVAPRVSTIRKIAGALGIEPEELAAHPKGDPPLPFSAQSSEAERGSPEWFEALRQQILDRASMYGDEAEDETSPHFQNATAASLWLERVQDELAMWTNFSLAQVGPFLPQRRTEGWKAIGDVDVWGPWVDAIGPLVVFDAAVRDGTRRLEAMNDKPDEIATRRLAKTALVAEQSRKRFEGLRAVNG